jgi:2-C-methyl-D-erythritol 4-phosphate cytidylyltransferase
MEDSVRLLHENEGSRRVDRTLLRRVQTPQVFLSGQIKQAYEQFYDPGFTDDASVYESKFGEVKLVEGNRENIKITTPADMKLAEGLIRSGD